MELLEELLIGTAEDLAVMDEKSGSAIGE